MGLDEKTACGLIMFIFYHGAAIFLLMSAFTENDLRHSASLLHKLNSIDDKISNLVSNIEVGVRNLWAKKYMMDWNNTHADTATKGRDEYGEYIEVHETNLYEYIGKGSAYEDILRGNVEFENGKQYCLKVKWRTPVVQSYGGLRLFFKYSDGTNGYESGSSIQCPMSTTQTVNTLISEKGKTITGVCCTYGTLNNARIYEIQLVQATKQPNDWMVAPEDIDVAIDAKLGKITGTNLNILYIGTDGVTSSTDLKYNASTSTLSTPKINITRTGDWTNNELKPLTTQSVVVGGISSGTNNLLFTRAAVQAGTGTTTSGTYTANTLYLNPQGGSIQVGGGALFTYNSTTGCLEISV